MIHSCNLSDCVCVCGGGEGGGGDTDIGMEPVMKIYGHKPRNKLAEIVYSYEFQNFNSGNY